MYPSLAMLRGHEHLPRAEHSFPPASHCSFDAGSLAIFHTATARSASIGRLFCSSSSLSRRQNVVQCTAPTRAREHVEVPSVSTCATIASYAADDPSQTSCTPASSSATPSSLEERRRGQNHHRRHDRRLPSPRDEVGVKGWLRMSWLTSDHNSHPPTYYLPTQDVKTELLTPSPRSSFCEVSFAFGHSHLCHSPRPHSGRAEPRTGTFKLIPRRRRFRLESGATRSRRAGSSPLLVISLSTRVRERGRARGTGPVS